jgi:hypothetical protein
MPQGSSPGSSGLREPQLASAQASANAAIEIPLFGPREGCRCPRLSERVTARSIRQIVLPSIARRLGWTLLLRSAKLKPSDDARVLAAIGYELAKK